MATAETDRLLALVRQALDEIDDRAVSVTARKTARIASMLGETVLAVMLGLELKPIGGHPPANAEDTRRLMADPSLWGKRDGPAEEAMTAYLENRRLVDGNHPDERIAAHSLFEIEDWLARIDEEKLDELDWLHQQLHMQRVLERVRHTCFAALCSWERQLTYANTNERIFERFRSRVDALLAAGSPDVVDKFSAVFRRFRDVAVDSSAPAGEELSQAVTTCRRILKAVIDHLLPGEHGAKADGGQSLDEVHYKNRLFEYIKDNVAGDKTEAAVRAAVGGLLDRFNATDALASKGVHADVGLEEAEQCALHTYIVAGELLAIAERQERLRRSS